MYLQGSSNAKVPTALCYCDSRRRPGSDYLWGVEASHEDPYHLKIQLDSPISPSKLVIDYLSAIRKEFMENLVEKYGRLHVETDFAIDWIFTVPSFVDEVLIQKFRESYLPKTGFTKARVFGTITHITEPHAAAVHILSYSQSQAPKSRLFAKNNSIFKVRINGLRDQSARYGV